jgi:hypothetical protein
MQAQRRERHVARITIDVRATQPWTSIRLAMAVKRVEMGVAPREDDLQRRMEGSQGRIATDEEPAPDQGADPLDDHTELIDVGRLHEGSMGRAYRRHTKTSSSSPQNQTLSFFTLVHSMDQIVGLFLTAHAM